MRLLRKLDPSHGTRKFFEKMADEVGEWAGIPMPLEGEQLVIAPSYPFAGPLMREGMANTAEEALRSDEMPVDPKRFRARFHSSHKRVNIVILNREDGKVEHGYEFLRHPLALALRTLGCSEAWGIEQESNALQLLGTMLDHNRFKQYMLTGMFLETSKRSRVTYVFRRLRPTVALVNRKGSMEPLCCLCMHPIGYYHGSYAGALCPTDDVVAHLQMMRGDEARYWRMANQHAAWVPESGIYG